MQIVCPNCKKTYQIADVAIGANGRSVRCVRCQEVWQVAPPPPAPAPVIAAPVVAAPAYEASIDAFRAELGTEPPAQPDPAALETEAPAAPSEPPPEPALGDPVGLEAAEPAADTVTETAAEPPPVALSDIPIPVEPLVSSEFGAAPPPAATLENDRPDIESAAARRTRNAAARKRKSKLRMPLAAAIAGLMVLSGTLIGMRKDVVRHVPQLASFYGALGMPVNLRGLAFTDLKIGNEIHDGVPVLVIEGMIVSTTSKAVDVPRLRFALRSASGAEVYSWTAPPSQPTLGPFESLAFRSRLASPPAEGHDIQVRFFSRRDAVASLR